MQLSSNYYSPSELVRPNNIQQTLEELKKSGAKARVVAGNTTLYEFARQGALADVEKLIDAKGLGLDFIRKEAQREGNSSEVLSVGCATTFEQLASSTLVKASRCWLALSEAAEKITPPQVRNMATIGGAVCSGIPFYDMPVVLVALDARAEIASLDRGHRMVEMETFFKDYFVTALEPEDLLVRFEIPALAHGGSSFVKLGRSSSDFAVVNVSVRLARDPSNPDRISDARVALGAVANTPIRAKRSEETLKEGTAVDSKLVLQASNAALSELDPTPSIHASSSYKKKIIPFLVRDAILLALERSAKPATRYDAANPD
ncbi:MAG TPA: FAD binding domain-containing protein [Nitrososphaerales archaeon]|nr:FAD binding domain-containing protein [Nitrososphaerales archaeon]